MGWLHLQSVIKKSSFNYWTIKVLIVLTWPKDNELFMASWNRSFVIRSKTLTYSLLRGFFKAYCIINRKYFTFCEHYFCLEIVLYVLKNNHVTRPCGVILVATLALYLYSITVLGSFNRNFEMWIQFSTSRTSRNDQKHFHVTHFEMPHC